MRAIITFTAAVAALLLGAGSGAAQVGRIPDGFTPIFDGKTINNWHPSRTTRHGSTPKAFVENAELVLKQQPYARGGLLFTNKKYRNFEFYVEVKAPWGCNSGLFLRSTEEGSAYQIEIDQTRGTGGLLGEGMRVSVGARPAEVDKVWKLDEWNSIRIRMEGDAPHITEWINGVQMFDVQEPVNDKIAGATSGYIGLQTHYGSVYEPEVAQGFDLSSMWKPDAAIRFRNIAIKELP